MQLLQIWLLNQKASLTQTAEVWLCFRRHGVAGRGKKVEGPDGTLYESVGKAQEAFLASQSMSKHLPPDDISKLRDFFYSADEIQEVLEVDGAVVTTNQLDDYNNRGDHPLLAPMTLYVYSMWGITC